jgi:translation initiation factor eIF-2B subunit delta
MSSIPQNQHRYPGPPSLSLQSNPTGQNDQSYSGAPPKSQKQMTKAERREIQERQRAAKATKAATTGPQTGGTTTKSPRSAAPTPPNQKKSGRGSESPVQARGFLAAGPSAPSGKSTKESKAAAAAEEAAGRSRGLRIFSHFAFQKPVVHLTKGDVHPAIVRLGLMFAGFKICGANARCIATLSVFKRVGRPWLIWSHAN